MSDGMLGSFWSSLRRAEQRVEAEARDAERALYRTLYGYESRVMRLRWALEASGPLARNEIAGKLKHISLDAIWHILLSIVKDIALYYGGSVVLGTAVGAGLGALVFGAGAIPGAALGFEAGMVLGEWVMMYLGLKMLAEGMIDTIPPAMSCYAEGFRAAWGPAPTDRANARYLAGYAPSKETAAQRFAHGHALMIMAILIAIVAYLTRGKSKEALFKAVGDSKRLGSKMADWLKDNEEKLLKEESLQPKARTRAELQEDVQEPLSKKPRVADPKKVSEAPKRSGANFSLDDATIKRIQGIPKGTRPDPATYMPKDAIEAQLSQFDNGASRFMSKANLEKYGPAQRDGTSFVMTKQQADQLLQSTGGDMRAMEDALGLPNGFLDSNELVRVDIPAPRELGLRIPSGNEAGANDMWIPGGKLPNGNLEAVVDVGGVPASSYSATPLTF